MEEILVPIVQEVKYPPEETLMMRPFMKGTRVNCKNYYKSESYGERTNKKLNNKVEQHLF